MPWLREQLGHILEPFRAFWDHWEAFGSILEHVRAPAGQAGALQGGLGHCRILPFGACRLLHIGSHMQLGMFKLLQVLLDLQYQLQISSKILIEANF